MSELPITKKEYYEAYIIGEFIKQMREKAESDERITDIHFKPKLTGYDITFVFSGIHNNISIEKSKHLISDKLSVEHLKGEKVQNKFKITDVDEITAVIDAIFK